MSEFNLDEIVKMREAGKSWNDIAKHYGAWRQRLTDWVSAQPDAPMHIFNPLSGGKRQPEREEIEAMMKGGLVDREIAERLGMKLSAFQRLRLRRGLIRGDLGVNRARKTEEELAEVKALLESEKMPLRAVAELTGVGYDALHRHFPEYAFTTEQTVEAMTMGRRLSRIAA